LYQDDAFGRAPFRAAVEQLNQLGITDVEALPYIKGSLDYSEHVQKLRRNPPDAIGFFATPAAVKKFLQEIGIQYLLSTNLFALSIIGDLQIRQYLREKGLAMAFASSVPNPMTSPIPIAQQFRKAMNDANNTIDVFAFEAYIAASLFIYGVDHVRDNPTPERVMSALEQIRAMDFLGIKLNFNPQTRSLATQVFVEKDPLQEWKALSL
jgi:ABC-type branched-subunit amino acid transport system substrate-binding protein